MFRNHPPRNAQKKLMVNQARLAALSAELLKFFHFGPEGTHQYNDPSDKPYLALARAFQQEPLEKTPNKLAENFKVFFATTVQEYQKDIFNEENFQRFVLSFCKMLGRITGQEAVFINEKEGFSRLDAIFSLRVKQQLPEMTFAEALANSAAEAEAAAAAAAGPSNRP